MREVLAKARWIMKAENIDFPVLIGPKADSEFAKAGEQIPFVATYCFFLNEEGVKILKELGCNSNARFREIEYGSSQITKLAMHYIEKRPGFRDDGALTQSKLNTIQMERLLSNSIARDGVIWFVNFGIKQEIEYLLRSKLARTMSIFKEFIQASPLS
jgi:hypothetical protein